MSTPHDRFESTLKLSAWFGILVTLLPLHFYPLAVLGPPNAQSIYAAKQYWILFVPYGMLYFVSSLLILDGKKNFILLLFFGFIASQFHFVAFYGPDLIFKSLWMIMLVVVPATVFLIGVLGVLLVRDQGGVEKKE